MKIAIDARYLMSDFTGIGVYSEQLLQALGRLDDHNEYVVLVHESYDRELVLPDNFTLVEDPARPVSLRTLLSLSGTLREMKPDIVHSLMPLSPLLYKGKLVATVFDLQPLLDPDFTSMRPGWKRCAYDMFYRTSYARCLAHADYLICISYATKNDVIRLFPEMADKILVIHAGIDTAASVEPEENHVERVRQKFNLPQRYLFYLGSTRPNKNLPMMLDAFEEFLRRHPDQEDLHWVLVLNSDRFFDSFFASVRQRGLLRRIQIHEQVTESQKKVFLQQAELLYFVTRFEGFGLPVLEAQSIGTPVLGSDFGSIPEVAGHSALLADPDSRDSIVAALEQFYYEPGLKDALIEAGRENLRRFSWDDAAKEIVDMYENLLS